MPDDERREGPAGGAGQEEELGVPLLVLVIIGTCFVLGLVILSLSLWFG